MMRSYNFDVLISATGRALGSTLPFRLIVHIWLLVVATLWQRAFELSGKLSLRITFLHFFLYKQIENTIKHHKPTHKMRKTWVIDVITEAVVQTLDEVSISLPLPETQVTCY